MTIYTFLKRSATALIVCVLVVQSLIIPGVDSTVGASSMQQSWEVEGFSDIASGYTHNCAVTKLSGEVWCWGSNEYGQLGDGTNFDRNIPVRVDSIFGGHPVAAISTHGDSTCAIADNKAYCWGQNNYGQLGTGDYVMRSVPVLVNSGDLGNKAVSSITASLYGTCAIADNKAYCWGQNNYGQLGDGSVVNRNLPVKVSFDDDVSKIAVGGETNCFVSSGEVYCMGRITTHGSTYSTSIPVNFTNLMSGVLADKTVTDISMGRSVTCVIADGAPYCWGLRIAGSTYLGNGTSEHSYEPVAVDITGVLSGKTVSGIFVSVYGENTCVLSEGGVYCWGESGYMLGNGSEALAGGSTIPVRASTTPSSEVTNVSYGRGIACVLIDSTAYCWGSNNKGQLGADLSPAVVGSNVPIRVIKATLRIENANYRMKTSQYGAYMFIRGGSFKEGMIVKVNDVPVEVAQIKPESAYILVPSSVVERQATISVTNPDGETATLVDGLTYYMADPRIDSLPTTRLQVGVRGGQMHILGSDFSVGSKVLLGESELDPLVVHETSTLVTVIYPYSAVAQANVPVRVKNANGVISNTVYIDYVVSHIENVIEQIQDDHIKLEITGSNFNGLAQDALTKNLAVVNGVPLGFCTTDYLTAELLSSMDIDSRLYHDGAPCLKLANDDGQTYAITESQYTILMPSDFDTENYVLSLDGVPQAYVRGSPALSEPSYIHNVPNGFYVSTIGGTDLSSTGTTSVYTDAILRTDTGILVAEIAVDTTSSRDWSTVTAGIDRESGRAFVHGLAASPGSVNGEFTLYVPKKFTDNSVVICPGVSSIDSIGLGCPNGVVYSVDDENVSVVLGSGFHYYWKITGLTGTGGMSLALSADEYRAITGRDLPVGSPGASGSQLAGSSGVPGSPLTGFAQLKNFGEHNSNYGIQKQDDRRFALLATGLVMVAASVAAFMRLNRKKRIV